MPSFSYTTPVRFSDVDHAGIVYYPRFFHFFHLAFEELWRARLGARAYVELLDDRHVGFPCVHADCDFRAPLRFGDDAEIELVLTKPPDGKSLDFRYRVSRVAPRALCAEGRVTCAVVDLQRFKAIPLPADLVQLFSDLVVELP
jgi:4-hydroxybenzoyl-CoA thioesterase